MIEYIGTAVVLLVLHPGALTAGDGAGGAEVIVRSSIALVCSRREDWRAALAAGGGGMQAVGPVDTRCAFAPGAAGMQQCWRGAAGSAGAAVEWGAARSVLGLTIEVPPALPRPSSRGPAALSQARKSSSLVLALVDYCRFGADGRFGGAGGGRAREP